MKSRTALGAACAVGCEILYGFGYVFTKSVSDTVSAFTLLGWRFLLAFLGMSLLAAAGVLKVSYRGKKLGKILRIALFFPVLYFAAETEGIMRTTASESGVLLACIPVASLLASSLLLKKKPAKIQTAGVGVTLVGVLVTVLGAGAKASFSVSGYFLLAVSVALYALYCVCVEKADEFTGAEITFAMLALGCLAFVPAAVAEGIARGTLREIAAAPFHDPGFGRAVLYQGFGCSIGAFFMSNVAIARIGVNRASSFVGLSTAVSILAGVGILGELFSFFQIVGAAVIVGGVYLANARTKTE